MAFGVKKTEHSGSKRGRGAYWGRKAVAKNESNHQRRELGKLTISEQGDERNDVEDVP